MQQVRSMNVGDGIIGAAASAAVAWLAASVTKVSKKDFEKVCLRLDLLEKDMSGRPTRIEIEQAFGKVDSRITEFRNEMRAEFKELKAELRKT